MTVLSTVEDPTSLNEAEYLEITNRQLLQTHFYHLILNELKSTSKNQQKLLYFLIYLKENEGEIVEHYNRLKGKIESFREGMQFRDSYIESYKSPKGIPLELSQEVRDLYSMNEDVTFARLEEIAAENEAKKREKEKPLPMFKKSVF